jgi:hypothetical protein
LRWRGWKQLFGSRQATEGRVECDQEESAREEKVDESQEDEEESVEEDGSGGSGRCGRGDARGGSILRFHVGPTECRAESWYVSSGKREREEGEKNGNRERDRWDEIHGNGLGAWPTRRLPVPADNAMIAHGDGDGDSDSDSNSNSNSNSSETCMHTLL